MRKKVEVSSGFSWKKELGVSTQAISTGVLVTPLFEISIQRKWTKKTVSIVLFMDKSHAKKNIENEKRDE